MWAIVTSFILATSAPGQGAGEPDAYRHWPPELMWVAVGPIEVPAGTEVGSLLAIGPASIAGKVVGDVVTIGGGAAIASTGAVSGRLAAVCASTHVAEGAKVYGGVAEDDLHEATRSPIGCEGTEAGEIIVGSAEFVGPSPTRAVVVGGDALVRAGAGLTEVLVLGGNLTIDPDTHVRGARVIGGTLQRAAPDPEAKDECLGPLLLRCAGHMGPSREAVARWATTYEDGTEGIKVAAYSESWQTGEVHVALLGPSLRAELTIKAKCALRSPRPKEAAAIGEGLNSVTGTGWDSWPRKHLWVPTDQDVEYQYSVAVGAGVRIEAVIEPPDAAKRQQAQRALTFGIPADAIGLVLEGQ